MDFKPLKGAESSESMPSRLEALYSLTPNWQEILACVKRGEKRFADELRVSGLPHEINVSRLHNLQDLEIQAFLASMSSKNPEEIETKAYLTYAIHWLDDFFDEPELAVKPKEMFDNRADIECVLMEMGDIGKIGLKIIDNIIIKSAAVKGMQRVLYGGLVQRSKSREERDMLVSEYAEIGLKFIDEELAEEIKKLKLQAFWMTNKVVMEFIDSVEESFDFNVSEVWNLILAPAIYYHDIDKEEERGVSGFEDDRPTLEEMLEMVKLGSKYLAEFADENIGLRIEQLHLITAFFDKVLPMEIGAEYKKIIAEHR